MTRRSHDLPARWGAPGFTLMEVLITMAIVGILSAIAYPSYTESVLKGRRAEARTALLELMQQQERYMTERNTYLAFTNTAGTTVPAAASSVFKVFAGSNAAHTAYWLRAVACAEPNQSLRECVRLEAVPVRADAAVGTLQLDSTGNKSCSGDRPAACWP